MKIKSLIIFLSFLIVYTLAEPISSNEEKLEYRAMIEQLFKSIEETNTDFALNSAITLFNTIFQGIKQCEEEQNKTQIINFLKEMNYPFEQKDQFNENSNIIALCSSLYEIYEDAVKQIIIIMRNETLKSHDKLITLFQNIITDYEGLKAEGLFDQLIFIGDVNFTLEQDQPQFQIEFVEYEQFEEIMNLHFSLLQAINALFEGQPIDIVLDYFDVMDFDDEQEKDMKKIEKMYLATYWNQIKEAAQNEQSVKEGWKKLYYQTIMTTAQKLRDECLYFEKQGIITKLERNSENERKYLPNIQCVQLKENKKKYVERTGDVEEL